MTISIRTIATLAVAVFLGIVAVLLTRGYVSSVTQQVAAPVSSQGTVPVVVAAQSLERGVVLQPNFLKVVNFPAEAAPTNAFHTIADLADGKSQRLTLRSLVANETILAPYVSGPGGKLNLSGSIAAGMRAVSLRSTDVTGVGGFVLPGDRVDVLVTRSTNSGNNSNNNTVTQVLAENVRVLGVDQTNDDAADKPMVSKAITVEVTPEQAAAISLAQSVGTVSLTLRHVADDAPLARKSMAVSDLGPAPQHKAVAAAAAPAIRVVRGTDTSRFTLGTAGGLERTAAQVPAGVAAP